MIEKQIGLIQQQIDKLQLGDFDLDAWKAATALILGKILGVDYQGIRLIESIKFEGGLALGNTSNYWDNMDSCKKQGKEILETCIMELKTFGSREKIKAPNPGISINLTQNQTVHASLLISALEDELTGSQMKEVKKIVKSEGKSTEKKSKTKNKIKSFGRDVASNVLANALTNPAIWG